MSIVKKSISLTSQQDEWIKAQMASGHYGNESEIVRELIRERQLQQQETPERIDAIRAKLIAAESSGFTEQSPQEILSEIKADLKID